jgi:predicted GNAT superfamily acetyltransferase
MVATNPVDVVSRRGDGIPVTVLPLDNIAQMERCLEIQRLVWGYADAELLPSAVFVMAQKIGGHVLGALYGSEMVGFALAFPARRNGVSYLHSHLAAVVPNCQNLGIGYKMKVAQREQALKCNLDLIEWTFDPLAIRNAHFNITRLGAIVRRFHPNLYGFTASPLHSGLPTDRVVAEWHLLSDPRCGLRNASSPRSTERVSILVPNELGDWKKNDYRKALHFQASVRDQLQELFSRHYAITGFNLGPAGGTYFLEPYEI